MTPYTGIMAPSTLDAINAEAQRIQFTRTALTAIAGITFGIGWLTCQFFAWFWLILAWLMAGVKEGWRSAKQHNAPRPPLPPEGVLQRENAELRQLVQALRNDLASRRQK